MKSFLLVTTTLAILLAACVPEKIIGPTLTPRPSATTTPIPPPTATPIPVLTIGSTQTSSADGMVMMYVPAGEFTMGLDADLAVTECLKSGEDQCSIESYQDAEPEHTVYVDSYWIDRTEVTNGQYRKCVDDGICHGVDYWYYEFYFSYFDNTWNTDYPITNITWNAATAYCQWAGRRLPTEAEWEKAARGTDGRLYPWGDTLPTCSTTNYGGCNVSNRSEFGNMSRVGDYLEDISPYGVLDMAGNVKEWVADMWSPGYYSISPSNNPAGPSQPVDFDPMIRGCMWSSKSIFVTIRDHNSGLPDYFIGFRCVQDATP